MDWMKGIALSIAALLSACASPSNTEVVRAGLPRSDNFRVQRSQNSDYDYLVSIRNGKDLGINADDQAARDRMALLALKDQCEAPQIVKETVSSGSPFLGDGARTYDLQVKC
jgi:hypothetical protein